MWAELQKHAKPLEDTPNSVMRRVFGLPEKPDTDADADEMDPRVTELMEGVGELVGQTLEVSLGEHGFCFTSEAGNLVAIIRPQRRALRIATGKQIAEKAGINDWVNELKKSRIFGGPSVRWHIPDGDAAANKRLAMVLATLWREGLPSEVAPLGSADHNNVGILA